MTLEGSPCWLGENIYKMLCFFICIFDGFVWDLITVPAFNGGCSWGELYTLEPGQQSPHQRPIQQRWRFEESFSLRFPYSLHKKDNGTPFSTFGSSLRALVSPWSMFCPFKYFENCQRRPKGGRYFQEYSFGIPIQNKKEVLNRKNGKLLFGNDIRFNHDIKLQLGDHKIDLIIIKMLMQLWVKGIYVIYCLHREIWSWGHFDMVFLLLCWILSIGSEPKHPIMTYKK